MICRTCGRPASDGYVNEAAGERCSDFCHSFTVSWQDEYYTDDDAASFDTLAQAEAYAARLRAVGKRRVEVDGPGVEVAR